jgi:DNA-binding transcriptional ArsR family regulator
MPANDAGEEPDTIVLRDPRAIRALAHPARIAVLHRLLAGQVLTATECADAVQLTPSAMSYHLRALQRWGLVDRAEPTGDGRVRPWRALGRHLRIEAGQAEASAAEALLLGEVLDAMRGEVLENAAGRARNEPGTRPSSFWHGFAHLTDEEATEFYGRVESLLQEYSGRPSGPGARQHNLWWAGVPETGPEGIHEPWTLRQGHDRAGAIRRRAGTPRRDGPDGERVADPEGQTGERDR